MFLLNLVLFFMSTICCANVLIIGHRGAKALEPENTMLSFQKAYNCKTDGIEFDVWVCKSGDLVLIHDNNTYRVAKNSLIVTDSNLESLRTLDVGKGQTIPTLDELLEFACKKFGIINIELKGPGTAKPVVEKIEALVNLGKYKYSDFVVTSFKWNEIEDVRKLNKLVVVGLLFEEHCLWEDFANAVSAKYLVFKRDMVNKDSVSYALQKGMSVWSYTVNNLEEAKLFASLGVTGIITDCPDLITKINLVN